MFFAGMALGIVAGAAFGIGIMCCVVCLLYTSEIMVFADDAAKVNRVLDKMNLDFVKSEAGEAVVEQAPVREGERVIDAEFTEKTEAKEELPAKTEKVVLPEGTIEFELDEEEHLFDVGAVSYTHLDVYKRQIR